MITIFSIPKPFNGRIATIQRNAILSWKNLPLPCEVILLGREKGVAEVAAELGVRHIPDVACNEYGTPLLNSAFSLAQAAARNPIMTYANADIIFLSDLPAAITRVPFKSYLMLGCRTNLDLDQIWNFDSDDWEDQLRSHTKHHGKLFDPTGIDYFVFPRNQLRQIPPFAVGRVTWDNWMIYYARQMHIPVVDATGEVLAIHQNHDYGHIKNGQDEVWNGPEAQRNLELAGGWDHIFSINDSTWNLSKHGVIPALKTENLKRYWKTKWVLHPKLFNVLIKVWGFRRVPGRFLAGKSDKQG